MFPITSSHARTWKLQRAVVGAVVAALMCGGCASAPKRGTYGVDAFKIKGAEKLDSDAITACVATEERTRFGFAFGGGEDPVCGQPPFDAHRTHVRLWSWPWTDWPIYEPRIFDRDIERIERWYRARGYYDAQVTGTRKRPNKTDRTIELTVYVQEGEPVLTQTVLLAGIDALPPELQTVLYQSIALAPLKPFDETLYNDSKRNLEHALAEASYAKALVTGEVAIDRAQKRAVVTLHVAPSSPCTFGHVTVEGYKGFPPQAIYEASEITSGQRFSLSALNDAETALYALGPFASVEIERRPNATNNTVDVVIHVVPARAFRYGVGVGMQAGGQVGYDSTDNANTSYSQWDLHMLGKIEHRNFLGGMRRLRIEDRPKFVFDSPFPETKEPRLGNQLLAEFRQPAFMEPRTSLVNRLRWDRGPDLYGGGFARHEVTVSTGPERQFFRGKLLLSAALTTDVFLPDQQQPIPQYQVFYVDYLARLDFRDDPRKPRSGVYLGEGMQHSTLFLPTDWSYVRVTPDARAYVPLPLGLVLASRVRFGLLHIADSKIVVPTSGDPVDIAFTQRLHDLGPLRQRLRGGGHNSVRGYDANTLGDAVLVEDANGNQRLDSGGLRQWEGSLELRVPITTNLGTVVFVDVGDVSRTAKLRFNYPQTTLGVGLRYHTIVGPLRLDAGFAPQSLQVIGNDDRIRTGLPRTTVFGLGTGAVHFTIGESF